MGQALFGSGCPSWLQRHPTLERWSAKGGGAQGCESVRSQRPSPRSESRPAGQPWASLCRGPGNLYRPGHARPSLLSSRATGPPPSWTSQLDIHQTPQTQRLPDRSPRSHTSCSSSSPASLSGRPLQALPKLNFSLIPLSPAHLQTTSLSPVGSPSEISHSPRTFQPSLLSLGLFQQTPASFPLLTAPNSPLSSQTDDPRTHTKTLAGAILRQPSMAQFFTLAYKAFPDLISSLAKRKYSRVSSKVDQLFRERAR